SAESPRWLTQGMREERGRAHEGASFCWAESRKGKSGSKGWQLTQRGDGLGHGPGLLLVEFQGADQSSEPRLSFGQQPANGLGLLQGIGNARWWSGDGIAVVGLSAVVHRVGHGRDLLGGVGVVGWCCGALGRAVCLGWNTAVRAEWHEDVGAVGL